jgi:hypothetical protein
MFSKAEVWIEVIENNGNLVNKEYHRAEDAPENAEKTISFGLNYPELLTFIIASM